MRSARIVASQGRKLPKTSRVPVLSVESTGSQNYRHSLVQAGISPLARFDEEETESDTSNDCTSTYDENYNSYARDELIRPNDDYRQLLHMRQLMAIRVPPPISKLEKRTGRRIQPLEVKKEIRRSVPDTDETCKRRFVKENGKLVLRTATQPPHNRTVDRNKSSGVFATFKYDASR
nr:hypothetical transcript [Hymenolepis microstoma]